MRAVIASLIAVALTALLLACNKAPAPPAPPSPPAVPAAPAPAFFAAGATYDCHSAQKSSDIFVRFDANGAVNMGRTAGDLKPMDETVIFDKSGQANWSRQTPGGWTETDSFDKNTGEWVWTDDPGNGGLVDQARYSCKPI